MRTAKELQREIESLEAKLNDPKTSQGDIRTIRFHLSNLVQKKKILDREKYESKNKVSFFLSDDYAGCSAGDIEFYFGYEVTKCPVKSHKTEEDCYKHNCEKREWVFQVTKKEKVVFEMLESELTYPESEAIEAKLIVGIMHYLNSLDKKKK